MDTISARDDETSGKVTALLGSILVFGGFLLLATASDGEAGSSSGKTPLSRQGVGRMVKIYNAAVRTRL